MDRAPRTIGAVQLDVGDLARRLDGRLVFPAEESDGGHPERLRVDGLAIDSRLVRPGQLFAALRAERDGHDFVDAAFAAGAGAVIVERVPDAGASGPSIVVASVPEALAELARTARGRLAGGRVVGITGSVGKTTTKDLLANVLSTTFRTVASERSFNNELGVPLTLANAPDGVEAAVVEMGARGAGHIRHLCELARPSVGVVTVVEGVHTEVMGPLERIAVAKRELVESLPDSGAAVLNAGDPNVIAMASHTTATVVTFGGRTDVAGSTLGEVHAEEIELDGDLRPSILLRSPWGSVPVHLGVRGVHNVVNALAAAAAGLWLGVPLGEVAAALEQEPASPWRMELVRVPDGPVVLNDAYNAGPTSMAAALDALAALPVSGRRIAVLGVMAELGPEGPDEHRRIAEVASALDIAIVAVGCDLYGPNAIDPGAGARVEVGEVDVGRVVAALGPVGPDDAVLVKGSRVAGLERVAAALTRRGP